MSETGFSIAAACRPLVAALAVPATWAIVAAILAAKAWNRNFLALFSDTDDATRLVVVRDLMGGQNWFDHVAHRLDTPYGADIHWSQLIDLPLSLIIRLFEALVPGQGEHIALFVWPLLLLLPALYLVARLGRRLCGSDGAVVALILAALTLPVSTEFTPGRIDHHNVQMVLVLWLAVETLQALRSNAAALRAGLAAATSLAIGAETALIVCAAIAAFGLAWVMEAHLAPRLVRFGWGFAGAMLANFLIAVGPGDWFVAQCDANSIVFVVAAFGTAMVFSAVARLPFADTAWSGRLAAGLAGAVVVAALVLVLFPACAAGPFAGLDPWLRASWLDRVAEVQPLWTGLVRMTAYAVASALPVLVAIVVVGAQLIGRRGAARRDWLIYGVILVAAGLGLVLQMRGARLAALLAVPGGVALILWLRQIDMARRGWARLAPALAMVPAWLMSAGLGLFVGLSLALPDGRDAAVPPLASCLSAPDLEALSRLTPARIAAPIDLGPYILLMTPHAVVGAPYHRNGDGIGDSYRIFGAPEETARAILARRGIDLIVACDAMLDLSHGDLDAPNNLARRLAAGAPPDWLTPLSGPDAVLRVYRVER